MSEQKKPEVYFHAGMMRTASTFMQKTVFPELTGIEYISKKQYGKAHKIISESDAEKVLVSFELNNALFFPHLENFAQKYPDAGIILVLRRQDEWIISHYKRALKNGFHEDFRKYFDIEADTGRWKHDDLLYYPKLEWVRKQFTKAPLVLFHHELRDNPHLFLKKILQYTGAQSTGNISFKPKHTSYSEKQLLFKRWVNHHTIFKEKFGEEESQLRKVSNKFLRYILLHLPLFIPFNKHQQELVPKSDKEKIRKTFKEDWEQCQAFAEQHNPIDK
jgi:hypothetical protein